MPAKADIQKSCLDPGFRRGDDIQLKLEHAFHEAGTGQTQKNPLRGDTISSFLELLNDLLDFFSPFPVIGILFGIELLQQPQKLPGMHDFFLGDVF